MKALILANEAPEGFALRENKEKFDAYMGEWYVFGSSLEKAGVSRGGAALEPPGTATVVSVRDGVRKVEDGPFPDTKEQLGGFFIVETGDLKTATDLAANCPSAKDGFVEVRAIPDYGRPNDEAAS